MMNTLTIPEIIALAVFVAIGAIFIVYGLLFVIIPYWMRCPRCKIHLASVKVREISSL